MRTITRLFAIVPVLFLGACACPFAHHHPSDGKSCADGHCTYKSKSQCPAKKSGPAAPTAQQSAVPLPEHEYYAALDKRVTIQEDLSAKLATAKKSGMTVSLQREIDAKRMELRGIESQIEVLDAKLRKS